MAVVFESRVKLTDDRTSWSIELKDTVDDRIVDCANLEAMTTAETLMKLNGLKMMMYHYTLWMKSV